MTFKKNIACQIYHNPVNNFEKNGAIFEISFFYVRYFFEEKPLLITQMFICSLGL